MLEKNLEYSYQIASITNDLFKKGEFDKVDEMILDLNFNELNSTEIVCWCRFTCCAKKHLNQYKYLIKQSKIRLKELGKNIDILLKGLI